MAVLVRQELYLWPPELAGRSLLIVLYSPVKTYWHIFQNLAYKYASLQAVLSKNRPLTIGPVWDLLVWVLVALAAIGLPLLILKDTVNDVWLFYRAEKKEHPLREAAAILGKLISYYVLAAVFLFMLFNYLVPEKMLFNYLGR